MNIEKLKAIVAEKNQNLEQEAVYKAKCIIDNIASCQKNIQTHEQRIVELREELKTLTIQQLDETKILG